ncbi:hypothetical protein HZA96_03230 [Candidatus Woesearchaeota archaeon]|nr:hypothetical protein [Candidatus Woesearchaeota archaeon]
MNTMQLVNQSYEQENDDYIYLDFQDFNQEAKRNRNKRRMISAKIAFEELEQEFLADTNDVDIYSKEFLEEFCVNDELKAWEESFMQGYLDEATEEQ